MGRECRALILFVCLTVAWGAPSAEAAKRSKSSKPYADATSYFRGPCESDPDGTKFAARACYLDRKFDAASLADRRSYQRPTCDRSIEIAASRKAVLAKAYTLAPNYMRGRLCRLTQLFLTNADAPWGSWGLWEAKDRPPGTGIFIAVSDRYLGDVKSLGEFETEVVAKLVGISTPTDLKRTARFTGGDDPVIVALSVLAHELGHILLAVSNADGANPQHPRRKVLGPPVSACFDQAFIAQSWDRKGFQKSMRRWVPFADQAKNKQKNVSFNLESLRGKAESVDDAVRRVYDSGEFATPWAAITPDEELPELFRYKVLADVKQPLAIRAPGKARDVSLREFLAGPVMRRKVDCLRQLKLFAARK
jgi:hypothetical protein